MWTELKVAVEIKEIKWIFKKTHTQETAANLSTELPVIVNAWPSLKISLLNSISNKKEKEQGWKTKKD